ncbi:cupin domain-containing protein [Comamonas sp. Z1]|nr:Cupin 2, conserved barrel [Comamonas thiooxydans]MBL5978270.1 cupin domain-containing protein [Comamonas sp. NyZ500]TFF59084.1 cupin domain-containing protein [Comamonas sp. A23]TYK76436.1 cupin domain-containing protein [Comamonas sp. Z1]EFI60558.1 Cupin 2, conserved barrel [Comamonas thiooxydans]
MPYYRFRSGAVMDHIHSTPTHQALDVAPYGARLPAAHSSVLFKAEDLEVIRVVLRSGQSLPPHRVPGSVSLQCLEGRLEVLIGQTVHELGPKQLMHLPANMPHAVRAMEDSSAIATIVLCEA